MSNLSFVRHKGDGVTNQFALSVAGENIGYFRISDIHGYVDDKEVPITIDPNSPHIVRFTETPKLNADILIRRQMPVKKTYADFERGNNFGHRQVNNTFVQQLYLTQELLDGFFPSGFYFKQDVDLGGHKITNLGDATEDSDAVNKKVTDSLNKRLESLENSVSGNSRFLPWTYNAVGGEDTLNPPYKFESARVFINGVRQRAGESFEIVDLTIMLAEPLEEGDWVDVELGTEPQDCTTAEVAVKNLELSVNNLHTTRDAITWKAGLYVEEPAQLYVHNNIKYLPNPKAVPFPFTTGATFNADNWVLSQINTSITVDSVYDLIHLSPSLYSLINTRGYHTPNGVGVGTYIVKGTVEYGKAPDNLCDFDLGNNLVAVLVTNGSVNVDQCGAKGDYYTDHLQQNVNPNPTDDTKAFQAAARKSFHVTMSDRFYYATDAHGSVDLTFKDDGTNRSQWRVTGASRMRSGVFYYGDGSFFLCQARGGSNTYFEHFTLKNIKNSTDTVAGINFVETTSVGIKLESATRVTIDDCWIQGFGTNVLAENVAGAWCEFLTIKNSEIFRGLVDIALRVNGGTNSFHGLNLDNTVIHTVPNGYGLDVGEGCYVYNSHLKCGFFGTGDTSEVSLVVRNTGNIEKSEFAVWSEQAGKVVLEKGGKVSASGFWNEHLSRGLIIEDGNTDLSKSFFICPHGERTHQSRQPTNKTFGNDTITKLHPLVTGGKSSSTGLHAIDGRGRSTLLVADDNQYNAHHFGFGNTWQGIHSVSYVDNYGGYHPDSNSFARYTYSVNAVQNGADGNAAGSIAGVQNSDRNIDCRPVIAYTTTDGTGQFALNAQMIYTSSSRPTAPIAGQMMFYGTSSEPSWFNGSGWVEANVTASDATLKTTAEKITDAECAVALDTELVKFKMLDSVAEKGETARYHYGVIAQQLIESCEKHGINVDEFGVVVRSPIFNEDGKEVRNIWKVRYHEFLCLQAEAQRRLIKNLGV